MTRIFWFCIAAAALVAGCRPPPAESSSGETLIDDVGHAVKLPARIDRIASLSPAATELLCAVGCCDKIVVRDEWSDFPPQVAKIPSLKGFVPSAELLLQYKPQLVIAHWPPPTLQTALDGAGIAWFGLAATTLPQVAQAHRIVGKLCGNPQVGADKAIEFARAIAAVRAPRQGRQPPRVFYELDAGDGMRPFTAGRKSFSHALLEAAGAINVFGDRDEAWFAVSAESVAAADPDVIVLGDADVAVNPQSPAALAARAGFANLRAVRSGCIRTVPNTLVSRPGPRLAAGLAAMAAAVRPCGAP